MQSIEQLYNPTVPGGQHGALLSVVAAVAVVAASTAAAGAAAAVVSAVAGVGVGVAMLGLLMIVRAILVHMNDVVI